MKKIKLDGFNVIGIKIRTTNKDMQVAKDIPAFWQQFMSENIVEKIPNKLDASVYAIYTNYESDYTGAYDMILGCKVSSVEEVPSGMILQEFSADTYAEYISKGKMSDNIVYNTWTEIWNSDIDRSYHADFEIYGEKAQNPEDMEVPIYVSIK